MVFPERFSNLPAYAFPRLRQLLDGIPSGGSEVVDMSIGSPKHDFPEWIGEIIGENLQDFGNYPPNDGAPELLDAISAWLDTRFGVSHPPEQILTLNGTREGLFNSVIALCPETKGGKRPAVLIPNPFYQCYAVAALAVGAEPIYVPSTPETDFLPDFAGLPKEVLDRAAVAFICSPSNPEGAVASLDYLSGLLDLAETHDFRVFADECYSEIYRSDPPPSLLQAVQTRDPERALAFHSLSKRSSLAGLRSGFVAAGPKTMPHLRQLRAYAGAPLPLPLQRAAQKLWADETHVATSRAEYVAKYDIANRVFHDVPGCHAPEAGFFLWLPVEDGEAATLKLWRDIGVKVLPGAYLAREVDGANPGDGYIRVAMVTKDKAVFEAGLTALRDALYG